MTRNLFILLFSLLVIALSGNPLFAAVPFTFSSNDLSHAQSAIYFSQRGNWREARYHGDAAKDKSIRMLVQWLQYRTKDSGASFNEITRFIRENPGWPDTTLLKQRAEEAIDLSVQDSIILSYFAQEKPLTGEGYKYLAIARARSCCQRGQNFPQEVAALLRQAWAKGNFGQQEEAEFLARYGSILRREDHHNRIDTLLWQGKNAAARHMLSKADSAHQKLYNARLLLDQNSSNNEAAVRAVPASLQSDPGLIYARLVWYERKGNNSRVRELLNLAPASPPYPGKWWDIKAAQIRQLLKEKNYRTAYAFAKQHGHSEGGDFAEAEWLSGWISLRYLKKPAQAYTHFYALYHGVQYPVSLSRGAYWAGRAAEANKNLDIAKQWYGLAAKYPDTFHGQLALIKLNRNNTIILPPTPTPSTQDVAAISQNALVKAAYLMAESNLDLSKKLLNSSINNNRNIGQLAVIANIGFAINHNNLSVEAAKQAARSGIILPKAGYPVTKLPSGPLEDALALAIIRQESGFDRNAESPVGALGMMQLMPATAQGLSRSLGIAYSKDRLKSDPNYNIQLGRQYLGKLISNFNGSYILAIASYNGGIGNVRKWLQLYGDPRSAKSTDDVLDWIENIPFSETRNYVHRILESMQIYRAILPGQKTGARAYPLLIETDLHR